MLAVLSFGAAWAVRTAAVHKSDRPGGHPVFGVVQERTKVKALSEELENPLNVHRWGLTKPACVCPAWCGVRQ